MAAWFYAANGEQFGPVEEPQVRALLAGGQIAPTDLVWTEGMPQWLAAGEVLIAPATKPVAVAAPTPVAAVDPIPLAYAALAINPVPVIPPDEGPFLRLGKRFSLGGDNGWIGVAIVSPRAFYLLKRRKLYSSSHFGLIGMLLAVTLSGRDDIRSCGITDLPEPVRAALEPKRKKKNAAIVVVPREAARYVSVGSLRGINIHVGGDKFNISKSLFAGGSIRRFMEQNGWILDHSMTPTAAPIHGPGFGRTFFEIEQKQRNTSKRMLAILGLVILIILILILIGALSA